MIKRTVLIKVIDLSKRKLTFQTTDTSIIRSVVLSISRYRIEPYQSNRVVGFVLVTNGECAAV